MTHQVARLPIGPQQARQQGAPLIFQFARLLGGGEDDVRVRFAAPPLLLGRDQFRGPSASEERVHIGNDDVANGLFRAADQRAGWRHRSGNPPTQSAATRKAGAAPRSWWWSGWLGVGSRRRPRPQLWPPRWRASNSHAAPNAILTPSETKAITRQRIPLFIRKLLPQQIEKCSRGKLRPQSRFAVAGTSFEPA